MREIKKIFLLCFLLGYTDVVCQSWVENTYKKNKDATFFDVIQSFEEYRKNVPYKKGNGYKPFAREIDFLEPRMPKSGVFPSTSLWDEWKKINKYKNSNSNWSPLGPFDVPIIVSNNKKRGNGRVNCIEFDPSDPDIFWVGSPGGGLWKTVDGGMSWSTNTDNLPVLGVSDILINPLNKQIMYIATGDADGGDTYSIGVLKSVDGGITWDTTGLSYAINQEIEISKLEMNPNFPDSIFAVTENNIFVTADGGNVWNAVGPSGRWRDIHYHPENTNILYAAKQTVGTSTIYRSLDGGSSWQISDNGIANNGKRRPAIAVTPANGQVVYALFSDGSWGYHGLYKSSDGGDSWSLQSKCTKNKMELVIAICLPPSRDF